MNLVVLLVGMLLFFSASLTTFILFVHAKRKSTPDIWIIELLFIANVLYIFGYAMELACDSLTWKMIFNHVQYFGLPFILPLWLIICLRFCNVHFRWTAVRIILLLLIPVTTLLFNLTHAVNGIFYSSYSIEKWLNINVLVFEKGGWYFVESGWKIVLATIIIFFYVRTYKKANGIKKKQTLQLLLLSVFAFFLALSSCIPNKTSEVDFVVLLISVSSVLLFLALFKYSLFDLIPLAYSQLFNGMDYPVLILSDSMSVIKANAAAIHVFPHIRNHLNIPLKSLFAGEEEMISKLLAYKENLVEVSMDTGKRFYSAKLTALNIKQIDIKKDYGYLLVLSDVTSHINLVHDLEVEASMDPLTGLLNRRMFFPTAEKTMRLAYAKGSNIAMMMIDIDHYKKVNDENGHQAGDEVLKEISQIIRRQVRESDVIGRYGGEEFLIMLPSTPPEGAKIIAERICNAVRSHEFNADGKIIHLTVSIGLATMMEAGNQCIDNLIFIADKALYEAKRKGRDRVCIQK